MTGSSRVVDVEELERELQETRSEILKLKKLKPNYKSYSIYKFLWLKELKLSSFEPLPNPRELKPNIIYVDPIKIELQIREVDSDIFKFVGQQRSRDYKTHPTYKQLLARKYMLLCYHSKCVEFSNKKKLAKSNNRANRSVVIYDGRKQKTLRFAPGTTTKHLLKLKISQALDHLERNIGNGRWIAEEFNSANELELLENGIYRVRYHPRIEQIDLEYSIAQKQKSSGCSLLKKLNCSLRNLFG